MKYVPHVSRRYTSLPGSKTYGLFHLIPRIGRGTARPGPEIWGIKISKYQRVREQSSLQRKAEHLKTWSNYKTRTEERSSVVRMTEASVSRPKIPVPLEQVYDQASRAQDVISPVLVEATTASHLRCQTAYTTDRMEGNSRSFQGKGLSRAGRRAAALIASSARSLPSTSEWT